ncbi:MAG: rhamnulokinase [Bacteroidota bacterium]|nr:rhamnulokinase [Bacteroidota bacterium]MDE2835876.1 rhamnulokinase [Bacteroidota bacterium]MDE2957615.1 rhamnulokinase [Bacteroidota bacterium]
MSVLIEIATVGYACGVERMSENVYLALDLGASSGRAILGYFDSGRMRMEEVHRFRTPTITEGKRLYWDLASVWEGLQEGLNRAVAKAPKLRSLSVDSWGVDYVPLDAYLRPLRRAHLYRDSRTQDMAEIADERMPRDDLYACTGVMPLSINTLYQVLADQQHTPELFRQTYSRLLIADYFNWRFCGRPVAEVSLASTTQLLDPGLLDWSRPAMDVMGIDVTTWPKVVPSGTILGPLEPADSVIAVIAGCSHDTACAVAAAPAEADSNWAFLSSGTWSLLGAECGAPVRTSAAGAAGFTNEVGFGGTIRLLKNLTGLWVLQECEREWRTAGQQFTYDTLIEEAAAASSLGYTIDFCEPTFTAPGDMIGRIAKWCRGNGAVVPADRGACVRLIFESLAEMYRATLKNLEALLGCSYAVLHTVGGGSRNALLNQWTADRCKCKVVAGPAEATALGNLLVQAHTMGDIPAGETIRSIAARSVSTETFSPNRSDGS